jgi:DNA-binding response OmpR family regulator
MDKPIGLIIEDEYDLANIYTEAVKLAGYAAEYALDHETAMRRLAEVTPALVVLDLHLGEMTGLDILRHIRGTERLAGVRVIVATADARKAEIIDEEKTIVFIKPVSFVQLQALATRLLPPAYRTQTPPAAK